LNHYRSENLRSWTIIVANKGKGKVNPVLNLALRREGVLGSGGIVARILEPRH